MVVHASSPATYPQLQPARGYVHPCSERDGVGNALRAIYDCQLAAPKLPDEFCGLLAKLR